MTNEQKTLMSAILGMQDIISLNDLDKLVKEIADHCKGTDEDVKNACDLINNTINGMIEPYWLKNASKEDKSVYMGASKAKQEVVKNMADAHNFETMDDVKWFWEKYARPVLEHGCPTKEKLMGISKGEEITNDNQFNTVKVVTTTTPSYENLASKIQSHFRGEDFDEEAFCKVVLSEMENFSETVSQSSDGYYWMSIPCRKFPKGTFPTSRGENYRKKLNAVVEKLAKETGWGKMEITISAPKDCVDVEDKRLVTFKMYPNA